MESVRAPAKVNAPIRVQNVCPIPHILSPNALAEHSCQLRSAAGPVLPHLSGLQTPQVLAVWAAAGQRFAVEREDKPFCIRVLARKFGGDLR